MKRALSRLLAALRPFGLDATLSGWSSRCPSHGDDAPRLTVTEGQNGSPILDCPAGCTSDAVLAAVGLPWLLIHTGNPGLSHARAAKRDRRSATATAEHTPSQSSTPIPELASSALASEEAPKPLSAAAYHGPLGELVRILEPQTEADPAAVLLQVLAAFGSIVGGGPYAIGGGRHHANLFVAIIGKTAKARKGVSMSEALRVFRLFAVGQTWHARRVLGGLSSGEGIVSSVRDPGGEDDAGESDKRVLFREEELARIMAAGGREGSTLSSVLRQAWDSAPLGIVTKAQRMHCAEPHVSVIAHCTRDELGSILGRRDVYNGLANRFLWAWASRSKLLPHGGSVREAELEGIAADVATSVDHALRLGDALVPWNEDARGLWEREYPELSKERPGGLGAILARSEAHVLRLSLIFALADRSRTMNPEHLRAALEVWRYCEDSARVIFGNKSGDRMLDKILEIVARSPEPVTPAQIGEALGWNLRAGEIAARLADLQAAGWLDGHEVKDGRGRPTTGWVISKGGGKVAA